MLNDSHSCRWPRDQGAPQQPRSRGWMLCPRYCRLCRCSGELLPPSNAGSFEMAHRVPGPVDALGPASVGPIESTFGRLPVCESTVIAYKYATCPAAPLLGASVASLAVSSRRRAVAASLSATLLSQTQWLRLPVDCGVWTGSKVGAFGLKLMIGFTQIGGVSRRSGVQQVASGKCSNSDANPRRTCVPLHFFTLAGLGRGRSERVQADTLPSASSERRRPSGAAPPHRSSW